MGYVTALHNGCAEVYLQRSHSGWPERLYARNWRLSVKPANQQCIAARGGLEVTVFATKMPMLVLIALPVMQTLHGNERGTNSNV